MSDSTLRDLLRRWQRSGSITDEAAYRRERVRAGELAGPRLDLAAHCGHPAARQVIGGGWPAQLHPWVHGLRRWGPEALVRAAVAAARFVYPHWSAGLHGPRDGEWVTEALRAAEEAVLRPAAIDRKTLQRHGQEASLATSESDVEFGVEAAADCCALAIKVLLDPTPETAWECVRAASGAEPEEEVLQAVQDELVPWALGGEDPLARWRT